MKLTLIFGGYFIVCAAAYLYNAVAPGDAPAWFLFLWLPLAILEKPFMPVLKALGLTSPLGPGWFSGDTPALLGHGLVMTFIWRPPFSSTAFFFHVEQAAALPWGGRVCARTAITPAP